MKNAPATGERNGVDDSSGPLPSELVGRPRETP
jgi:hypothetical protein